MVLVMMAANSWAIEELVTEEDIADLLAQPAKHGERSTAARQWAVLPQLGYGPDTGPVIGSARSKSRHTGKAHQHGTPPRWVQPPVGRTHGTI